MKICHVINSLSGGGAETHLLDLVKAQINEGHEYFRYFGDTYSIA